MNEPKYLNGLIIKKPHENAPEFVKAKISIKREELIETLMAETGEWINLDIKENREGKFYAQVDDWKPNGQIYQNESKSSQNATQQATSDSEEEIKLNDLPF